MTDSIQPILPKFHALPEELERCLRCLYIAVDSIVADDVNKIVRAHFNAQAQKISELEAVEEATKNERARYEASFARLEKQRDGAYAKGFADGKRDAEIANELELLNDAADPEC